MKNSFKRVETNLEKKTENQANLFVKIKQEKTFSKLVHQTLPVK